MSAGTPCLPCQQRTTAQRIALLRTIGHRLLREGDDEQVFVGLSLLDFAELLGAWNPLVGTRGMDGGRDA